VAIVNNAGREDFMSFATSLVLASVLATPAAPPVVAPAPVNVNVIVGPNVTRQFYYPPYRSYNPYWGVPAAPIVSWPTISPYYSGAATYPGIVVSPSTAIGVVPVHPLLANPGMVAGAPPAQPAAVEVDKALQGLSSPRERERIDAIVTLGSSRLLKGVEPLERILSSDPSARVREAAARALGLIGSPASVRALQTAAQGDDDRDVRHSAQFAAESIRAIAR
jgi:hypothetical protein